MAQHRWNETMTTPTVLADGTWIFPTGCWNRGASPSRPLISRDQGVTFELGGPLHAADVLTGKIVSPRGALRRLVNKARKKDSPR